MKKEFEKINNDNEAKLPLYPDFSGEIRLCPDDYVSNSASATECTGMIQIPPENYDEAESYSEIYVVPKVCGCDKMHRPHKA